MQTALIKRTTIALVLGFVQFPLWAAGQTVNEVRTVSANEKIEIEVQSGEVRILAAPAAQFSVQGQLDEFATGYELLSKDGVTRFVVKMPQVVNRSGSDNQSERSQLDVSVPVGSVLRFTGVNTQVSVKGVTGGARLKTVNGDITANELQQEIELETVNGNISSTANQGRLHLSTVNGSISDQDSTGTKLEVDSVNGEVRVDSRVEEVELELVNGQGELKLTGTKRLELSSVNGKITASVQNSKAPKVEASSVSGAIRLLVDKDISARFVLQTSAGGSISNGLTKDQAEKAKFGPGRKLKFSTIGGEGEVEISTVSGGIELASH